jgi:hypothetical protein
VGEREGELGADFSSIVVSLLAECRKQLTAKGIKLAHISGCFEIRKRTDVVWFVLELVRSHSVYLVKENELCSTST